MAKERSPESAGERAMFVRDAAPFALPAASLPAAPPLEARADAPPVPAQDASGPDDLPAPWRLRDAGRLLARSLARARQAPPIRSHIANATDRIPSRAVAAKVFNVAVVTELDRGIAFLLAPVFLAAGALAYFALRQEPGFVPLVAGVAGLALCAFAARARPLLNMALAAGLLCVLGALLAKAETWRAATKMLGGEVTTQLSGRVAEVERLADGRVRLTIDVTGTERPVLRYAPDRVRVSARHVPEGLGAGAVVTGLVRLMPPSGPVRPDSYDFSFESYFDGIGANGFFLRGPELAASPGPPPLAARFDAAVERARQAIADRIRSRIGGPEGEIAAALVVGVRAGIPEDINEALRRSGIYHVISISGLHMALVAGTIMVLLRSGFALFPDFSSRHPVKKYAAALAIVGLAGYLFISGAEVAAQRSFIMLAVMLAAVLFDRAALTLRNLAISAIIVIAVSPHEVVGPSFQMSFAATAALVGAYAAWSDWRADRPGSPPVDRSLAGRGLRYLLLAAAGLAVTSIVAGGATTIYAAWHFQQMPSLGLFTNLTAMPIVSAVVMPFAVFGALAMPFGLDGPFFHVMGLGLSATIAVAKWFSERSPADIVGLIPPAAVAVLTVALLIATICSTWLRIAAVPVALAGLMLLVDRPRPDLFVSEDGRLVGLALGDGRIAVNRARPNEFTIDNWKRAIRADEMVRPEGKQQRTTAEPVEAGADAGRQVSGSAKAGELDPTPDIVPNNAPLRPDSDRPPAEGFICAEGLCLARHSSGAVVAHALDAQAALDACAVASVIVIDDATARNVCRWKDVLVVTKRDLALNGSAVIELPSNAREGASAAMATAEYALSRPFRPWHEQRRFSREARGLPAYQRKPKSEPQANAPGKQAASEAAGSSSRQNPSADDRETVQ